MAALHFLRALPDQSSQALFISVIFILSLLEHIKMALSAGSCCFTSSNNDPCEEASIIVYREQKTKQCFWIGWLVGGQMQITWNSLDKTGSKVLKNIFLWRQSRAERIIPKVSSFLPFYNPMIQQLVPWEESHHSCLLHIFLSPSLIWGEFPSPPVTPARST